MNMLNLPTLLQTGLAHWLIAVAAPQSIQQAPPPLQAQLVGPNLYVLLMLGVLIVALLAVAWMARGLLQRAREFQSINLRLQGELAAREDFAEQLQQLNAQLEQRTAEVQRLHLAVEQTPASVVLTGRNARIDYVNPSFVAQTGYTAAEVIGKNPRILQSGLHTPEYYAQMWRTLTNGEVWRGEMCNRDKHGNLYWEDTSIAPIRNDRGRISSYVAVKIDITARKQAEQKKQEAEQQFRSLVGNLPAVVYRLTCDPDYTIQFISDAVETLCGYPASDFINNSARSFVSVIHPEDVQMVNTEMRRAARAQEPFELRFRLLHRDGTVRDVMERGRAIYGDDGKPRFIDGVITDITVHKQAQQKLQAAKIAAEEATRAKSQFLASMSHELRTPLNGVIGMMELLAGTELTEQQRQLADTCRNSGESLLYLINDILDFSKIEAGKLELELHDFELEKLISDTAQTLHWRAAEKGLKMPSQVDQMSGLIVTGDSNRLRQVLVNLLGNAIKFTQTGEVAIGSQIVDRQPDRVAVRFSISDTGVGIAADKLAKLFQPFSQVDASTTRNYGGTGLGLTISQRLVELMGGTIEVESQVEVGSRFWFQVTFPVVRQAAGDGYLPPSDREPVPAAPVSIPPSAHVLLAEDNNINQMYMTELFKQLGVRCDLADTGRQACDAVQRHRYDLVLMDCQMPDMDGFEATQQIRQWEAEGVLTGHLPIIALTAMAVKGDRQRCLDAGMDEYLSKPVQREQIVDVFQQFLQPAECPGKNNAAGGNCSPPHDDPDEPQVDDVPPPSAPLDTELLLQRCFHDIDFACSLLDELLASGNDRVQNIRRHAQRREAAATAEAAHALKGAAGILCADSVQRLAAEIEQAGRQENIDDIDDTLNRLHSEMQRCLDFVPQLREQLQTMVKDA